MSRFGRLCLALFLALCLASGASPASAEAPALMSVQVLSKSAQADQLRGALWNMLIGGAGPNRPVYAAKDAAGRDIAIVGEGFNNYQDNLVGYPWCLSLAKTGTPAASGVETYQLEGMLHIEACTPADLQLPRRALLSRLTGVRNSSTGHYGFESYHAEIRRFHAHRLIDEHLDARETADGWRFPLDGTLFTVNGMDYENCTDNALAVKDWICVMLPWGDASVDVYLPGFLVAPQLKNQLGVRYPPQTRATITRAGSFCAAYRGTIDAFPLAFPRGNRPLPPQGTPLCRPVFPNPSR